MMLHMLPHVFDFDPHSGDYGLGFFGISLETGSYLVDSAEMGALCFQCELTTSTGPTMIFSPTDAYRQRSFIEPLALYLEADTGHFKTISVDLNNRTVTVEFELEPSTGRTFESRRLRLTKTSNARPGISFKLASPSDAVIRRAAWEFSADELSALVTYEYA